VGLKFLELDLLSTGWALYSRGFCRQSLNAFGYLPVVLPARQPRLMNIAEVSGGRHRLPLLAYARERSLKPFVRLVRLALKNVVAKFQ
jgi:hypothetical protein